MDQAEEVMLVGTIKAGDKFWFPPHPEGSKEGNILTVMRVETMPCYGECVWWTDGSWCKVSDLGAAHQITDEFMLNLWSKSRGRSIT